MPMLFAYLNGSIKSDNVKATYDGTKWSTSEVINYSPSYQYYAYYPYSTNGLSHLGASSSKGSILASEISAASGTQAVSGARAANAPRAVSANTSASDFFASGISAFTPAVDQSSNNGADMTASDLQVGRATINRTTADDITFDLSHAMGMAQISVTTAEIPTTVTYDGNTSTVISYSDDKTTVGLVKAFSGNMPLSKGNNTYYAIVNPTRTTTFHSTDVDILQNPWTLDVQVAANTIHAYNNPVCTRPSYQIARAYGYTGTIVSYSCLYAGTYKLEIGGSQGGTYYSENRMGIGGKGGYATGVFNGENGQQLYICVGGRPYNGGGGVVGGGATHIATTNRGILSQYANYQSEILIVAGGGGGCEWLGNGGSGGGLNGGTGNCTEAMWLNATGGTSTQGGTSKVYSDQDVIYNGSFGQGGYGYSITSESTNDFGGGGGGGWYGGGGTSYAGGAGGGSGHINEAYITNGSMESGVREGTGYATITYVP